MSSPVNRQEFYRPIQLQTGNYLLDVKQKQSIVSAFEKFEKNISNYGFTRGIYILTLPTPVALPKVIKLSFGNEIALEKKKVNDIETNIYISGNLDQLAEKGDSLFSCWSYDFAGGSGEFASIKLYTGKHRVEKSAISDMEVFLIGFTHLMHNELARCFNNFLNLSNRQKLTSREIEMLKWTADGKTTVDISNILFISKRTVEVHISNAMNKLCASTKSSAVLKAYTQGLLRISEIN